MADAGHKYRESLIDYTIPILNEKPATAHEFLCHPPEIFFEEKFYTFCEACNLWVEGHAWRSYESDIGPLCGREGYATVCRRCKQEINFFGKMS